MSSHRYVTCILLLNVITYGLVSHILPCIIKHIHANRVFFQVHLPRIYFASILRCRIFNCAKSWIFLFWKIIHHIAKSNNNYSILRCGGLFLFWMFNIIVKKQHMDNIWNLHSSVTPVHDDVIKWKHFPRYWPLVQGIHRSPVNSPHKGQWRRALMFSFICAWINGWVNNRETGDLRRHRTYCDFTVMSIKTHIACFSNSSRYVQ